MGKAFGFESSHELSGHRRVGRGLSRRRYRTKHVDERLESSTMSVPRRYPSPGRSDRGGSGRIGYQRLSRLRGRAEESPGTVKQGDSLRTVPVVGGWRRRSCHRRPRVRPKSFGSGHVVKTAVIGSPITAVKSPWGPVEGLGRARTARAFSVSLEFHDLPLPT
jgi:hypothetical protein